MTEIRRSNIALATISPNSGDIDHLIQRIVIDQIEIIQDLGFKLKEKEKKGDPNEWVKGPLSIIDDGHGWSIRYDVGLYTLTGSGITLAFAWKELEISARWHREKVVEEFNRVKDLLDLVC
jgi:hypothetical protein